MCLVLSDGPLHGPGQCLPACDGQCLPAVPCQILEGPLHVARVCHAALPSGTLTSLEVSCLHFPGLLSSASSTRGVCPALPQPLPALWSGNPQAVSRATRGVPLVSLLGFTVLRCLVSMVLQTLDSCSVLGGGVGRLFPVVCQSGPCHFLLSVR